MIYFLYFLLSFTNIVLILIAKKKGYFLITLPALLYTVSSLYSFVGSVIFNFSTEVPFDLFRLSHQDTVELSIVYFMICSTSYLLGVVLLKGISSSQNSLYIIPISQNMLLTLSLLWFVIYVPSYGVSNIVERHIYIPEFSFRQGVIISTLLLPVSSFCLGYLNRPVIKKLIFICYLLILIMTSSRAIVIFISLFFVGSVLRTGKVTILSFFLTIISSIWLTAFALFARYQPVQGFQNIVYFFSWFDIDNIQLSINYLFSFSVGVLSYAQTVSGGVNLGQIFSYLNPLPSNMINFKEHENLIGAAPYSANALLYIYSPLSGVIYFLLSGVIFGRIYKGSYSSFIYSKLFVCLSLIFAFMSLQYTLRAATRIIYYAIFIYFIYIFFKKILRNIKS